MRDEIHLIRIPPGGEAVIEASPHREETLLLVENPKRPSLIANLLKAANPLRFLQRRENIAGYKDEFGVFHPIRWDPDYDYEEAGEPREYATNRSLRAEDVRLYMRRRGRRAARRGTTRTARRRTARAARRRTRRRARRR